MSDQQQAKFDGWAIVDVMGHQRYVGYVTTEAYGQAVLFRIDVPALDARERVTVRPGYHPQDGTYLPSGTTVQEGAVDGYTKLVGSGSIYTITPCTKEAALKAVEASQPRPFMVVSLGQERQLSPSFDLVGCSVCHSTAMPCECDSAELPDLDDDETAALHGAGERE